MAMAIVGDRARAYLFVTNRSWSNVAVTQTTYKEGALTLIDNRAYICCSVFKEDAYRYGRSFLQSTVLI